MTKTITITEEQYEFLKELQRQLKEQDTDGQAEPRFWTIGDVGEEMTFEGEQDYYKIYSPLTSEAYLLQDYMKDALEDEELTEEARKAHGEITDDDEALEWVQKYMDSDAYLVPLRDRHIVRENTMFLTKEDAVAHLVQYGYNYTPEAHTYAMTALRSPSVEKLLTLLETIEL